MVDRRCIDCGAVITDRPGVLCAACAAAGDRPIAPRAQGRPPQTGARLPDPAPPPVYTRSPGIRSNLFNRIVMFFLLLICGFIVLILMVHYQGMRTDHPDTSSGSPPAGATVPPRTAGSQPPGIDAGPSATTGPAAPPQSAVPYTPLPPYPYNRSTPTGSGTRVSEGKAPNTDEEIRQAIAADPDGQMAKAQEFYVRADGQRMWRYTETVPAEPKVELQDFDLRLTGGSGHFEGSVLFRNRSLFHVMDLQIALVNQGETVVLVPPSHPDRVLVGAGVDAPYRFSGDLQNSASLATARLRVEAQIEGPPGLVVSETDLPGGRSR